MKRCSGPALRSATSGRRAGGFTLIEMLIVIIIIVILATTSVMLMNVFFRGQGVRQGAMIVSQAVAECKQRACEKHRVFFLVFSKTGQDAWVEIHEDNPKSPDGIYQGDQDPTSVDADPVVDGLKIDLPKWVVFQYSPQWVAFTPSGYTYFNGSFKEVQASTFDAVMNGSNPNPIGDVIMKIQARPYFMCLDLDRASGKIRRSFFLNQEQ